MASPKLLRWGTAFFYIYLPHHVGMTWNKVVFNVGCPYAWDKEIKSIDRCHTGVSIHQWGRCCHGVGISRTKHPSKNHSREEKNRYYTWYLLVPHGDEVWHKASLKRRLNRLGSAITHFLQPMSLWHRYSTDPPSLVQWVLCCHRIGIPEIRHLLFVVFCLKMKTQLR